MGESVAEGAVGKEEVVDTSLGKNVAKFGGGGTGDGEGSGAGRGAELATKFKSLKKGAPVGVDAIGIGFPSFVQFFQKSGVAGMPEPAEGRGGGEGGTIGVETIEDIKRRGSFGRGLGGHLRGLFHKTGVGARMD